MRGYSLLYRWCHMSHYRSRKRHFQEQRQPEAELQWLEDAVLALWSITVGATTVLLKALFTTIRKLVDRM